MEPGVLFHGSKTNVLPANSASVGMSASESGCMYSCTYYKRYAIGNCTESDRVGLVKGQQTLGLLVCEKKMSRKHGRISELGTFSYLIVNTNTNSFVLDNFANLVWR